MASREYSAVSWRKCMPTTPNCAEVSSKREIPLFLPISVAREALYLTKIVFPWIQGPTTIELT